MKQNFWCFDTNVRKNEIENVNEQSIDNFFIDFDMTLNVAIEKYEHFNNIDANQNIDFNVAKEKIKKTKQTNK